MTTGLPIEDVVADIVAALAGPGVGVVVASPGAGKTTVVPLRLLDAPWLGKGRIVVLEPRRVAARAAARRLSQLLGDEVGRTVGYTTRDDRRTSAATRIEVVTDGILTRRLQDDPALTGVNALIFDEFHERRIQSDLGLAMALDVRRSIRPDLRILVMSATLDASRVADLLGDAEPAPVVVSEGRLHPVDVRWRPMELATGRRRGRALAGPTAAAITEALAATAGDVLTFLPGMAEIRATADALAATAHRHTDVRILHGSLPSAEQDDAIAPAAAGRRKIVLSTDVAETSLTVEGVTAIVDAGMQRQPVFEPRAGLTRLVTVAASQASATQRTGRAGRLGPGVAFRLWSQAEHSRRDAHSLPEITQVDLAGFLLEAMLWGADLDDLALLDRPDVPRLDGARRLLEMLGAVDAGGRLSPRGRSMATLPLQPRTAAMVLEADPSVTTKACRLAALLEEGDVLRSRHGTADADLDVRLSLLADPGRRHPDASGARLATVRRRARELERRLPRGTSTGVATTTGRLVAAGYPDRIAQRRSGQRGRFLLRNGVGASVDDHDPLSDVDHCVVADLDGADGDARIRLAAVVDLDDVVAAVGSAIEIVESCAWDAARNDLYVRSERRLGVIVLASSDRRPRPDAATLAALTDAVGVVGLDLLAPSAAARRLQRRLAFLHDRVGGDWPDVTDDALVADRDRWMPQLAAGATGRRDLERIGFDAVLRTRLAPHQHGQIERLAPEHFTLPGGKRVAIDYEQEPGPRLRLRVQDAFGLTETPTIAGGSVRLVFDLRSPADRTVQLTSDLAGFWDGTWHDVRKEMAGRYPKHDWPERPARQTGT